jgi:RNA polymerase primary sigma factor
MARAHNELSAGLRRDPSDGEVAKKLGWNLGEVWDAKNAMPDAASLDRPLGSEKGSSELGDFVEDESASDTPGTVMGNMESSRLETALDGLPERARYVVVRRYGLDDKDPATLAELGDELGVSRERVRQVLIRAERLLKGGEFGEARQPQ